MSTNIGTKISYLLVGLGIGGMLGVLFAPKSGKETRENLVRKAEEGKEYAQDKVRELGQRAEELVERGKRVAERQKDSVSDAVDAGRDAFDRLKSKVL